MAMSREGEGAQPAHEGQRLEGWTQIADYLRRGVRTVQRWEKESGLPVRRIGGARSGLVYALRSELDAWRDAVETGGLGDRLAPKPEDLPSERVTTTRPATVSRLLQGAILVACVFVLWVALRITSRARAGMPGPHASFVVTGHSLRALDNQGNTRWSHEFESPLLSDYEGTTEEDPRGPTRADLDADGQNETLFPARSAPGQPHEVFVFDDDGRVRLRWRPQRSVQFGQVRFEPPFDAGYLVAAVREQPGRFWAVARHWLWFPALLAVVDAQGSITAEYWNNGPIMAVERTRLRGRPVALVGGTASEFWSASLAVLDAGAPSGSAPSVNPEFACRDCPPGEPWVHVVFPRTDLGGNAGSWSQVERIVADDRGVVVDVRERVQLGPKAALHVIDTNVRFSFGRDLEFIGASPDAGHAALHDALARHRRLDHDFGPRDLADLQNVRAWDGERYVTVAAGSTLPEVGPRAGER